MTFYISKDSFIAILLDTFEISIGRHHKFSGVVQVSLPKKCLYASFPSLSHLGWELDWEGG